MSYYAAADHLLIATRSAPAVKHARSRSALASGARGSLDARQGQRLAIGRPCARVLAALTCPTNCREQRGVVECICSDLVGRIRDALRGREQSITNESQNHRIAHAETFDGLLQRQRVGCVLECGALGAEPESIAETLDT